MNNEQEYNELWHQAYKVAMYILRNSTDAEDIAQTCTIKYYLKKDEIENSSAWIKTVAKHEAFKLAKKQNKTYSLNTDFLVDQKNIPTAVDLDKYTDPDYDPPEDFTNTTIDAKELLNKEEYKIYKCYLNCKTDINKFAKKMNLSYRVAISRMYQIKRNLRAAKYQKDDYIGTKKIIGYKINRSIVRFIKTLVKKLNENDLKSLYKYFAVCEDTNILQTKSVDKVVKILDYNIEKRKHNLFYIVIPYILETKNMEFMQILFKINKFNHIKILKFSFKTKIIAKLDISQKQLFDTVPRLKKGSISCEKRILNKIMNHDDIAT